MGVKEQYIAFKNEHGLRVDVFQDRVRLQEFLRQRLEEMWAEHREFAHGGLFTNYMTGFALGFAYYDCRPTAFCRERCYGLPLSGVNDYYMFRLAVLTSESLKRNDARFMKPLGRKTRELTHLKIGHWGDAVPEQVPAIMGLARNNPSTTFWWYTRKMEIATMVNGCALKNLRAYLSLDPETSVPSSDEYPYGFTYLFGDNQHHPRKRVILDDPRLVAVFSLKKRSTIEPPINHPRMCPEKARVASCGKGALMCLVCRDRCNFTPVAT
jgi:hypothetical protein